MLLQAIKEHSIAASASSTEESSRKHTVHLSLDEKIAARVPAYLQNCRQNVTTMLDALDRADFGPLTLLGHDMSGSGGMFGFQVITDIGAGLVQAADSADTEASRKWVSDLSSYLDGVEADSVMAGSVEAGR